MFDACVVFVDEGVEAGPAMSWLEHWITPTGRVQLVGRVPRAARGQDWGAFAERLQATEARLGAAARSLGDRVVRIDFDVGTDALSERTAPLVVLATTDPEQRRSRTERALEDGAVVAWVGGAAVATPRIVVPFVDDEIDALPAAALALSLASDAELTGLAIHAFGRTRALPSAEGTRALLGWPRPVKLVRVDAPLLGLTQALVGELTALGAQLVMLTAPREGLARTLLLRLADACFAASPVTTILLPDRRPAAVAGPPLDAMDAIRERERVVGSVDTVDGFGRAKPWSGAVALVAAGAPFDAATVVDGRYTTRVDTGPSLGLSRTLQGGLAQVERSVRVVPRDDRPIALFDAAEDARWLSKHQDLAWWAVRLDPKVSPTALRAKHPHADAVVDADTVLDDRRPDDIPFAARTVRLNRCARRLRAQGLRVALVVGGGAEDGFATAEASELATMDAAALGARRDAAWRAPGRDRLLELTAAPPELAHRLELVLDNTQARRLLLAHVGEAQAHVHLQVYIFEEDATGALVAEALCAAARRGVAVRVLVDALRGDPQALGWGNVGLARLHAEAGVELRLANPISGLPDLHDLKARDHRKLLIVDDRIAHVTGRNVGDPYYRGWGEVALTAATEAHDVPWQDAGIVVEGQVLRAIGSAFVAAWRAAGGQVPDAGFVGPAGEIPVRFVVHRSLVDAHTLDLYRALIDRARTRITLVNTFPVQFELQAAFLRALARGVHVRFVIGNVRPVHGPGAEPFHGGQLRDLATMVVHGRLDALVEAGAEALELGLRDVPGWDTMLGVVRPHVHAKVMCVDGEVFTVGSANLDITAGYWESEAVLLVEDAALTVGAEAAIEALLVHAVKHDPADPAYRLRASRRGWLARNWPSVLG